MFGIGGMTPEQQAAAEAYLGAQAPAAPPMAQQPPVAPSPPPPMPPPPPPPAAGPMGAGAALSQAGMGATEGAVAASEDGNAKADKRDQLFSSIQNAGSMLQQGVRQQPLMDAHQDAFQNFSNLHNARRRP